MYGPDDHFDIERSHALGAIIKKVHDASIESNNEVELWKQEDQLENGFM